MDNNKSSYKWNYQNSIQNKIGTNKYLECNTIYGQHRSLNCTNINIKHTDNFLLLSTHLMSIDTNTIHTSNMTSQIMMVNFTLYYMFFLHDFMSNSFIPGASVIDRGIQAGNIDCLMLQFTKKLIPDVSNDIQLPRIFVSSSTKNAQLEDPGTW